MTCCDLHNHNCEPPSELCCGECPEAGHYLGHQPCIWLTCQCGYNSSNECPANASPTLAAVIATTRDIRRKGICPT